MRHICKVALNIIAMGMRNQLSTRGEISEVGVLSAEPEEAERKDSLGLYVALIPCGGCRLRSHPRLRHSPGSAVALCMRTALTSLPTERFYEKTVRFLIKLN
jgi:hypothetical protein